MDRTDGGMVRGIGHLNGVSPGSKVPLLPASHLGETTQRGCWETGPLARQNWRESHRLG